MEDKDIFVTQGDLMNLWFILSKQSNKSKGVSEATPKNPDKEGLNAVADLLLDSGDGMCPFITRTLWVPLITLADVCDAVSLLDFVIIPQCPFSILLASISAISILRGGFDRNRE